MLSARRAELTAALPVPPHDVLMRAVDKLTLAELGERFGLDPPRTLPVSRALLDEFRFPAVVKARAHALPGGGIAGGRLEAAVAADPGEAQAAATAIEAAGGEPLLQERVEGSLVACSLVLDRESRPLGWAQQTAGALWPPEAGVSARARTVPADPELRERILGLLGELSWEGLAEVQFIRQADGALRLIDLNARLYGSLALAVSAGVDLASMWATLSPAPGSPVPVEARPGVEFVWLEAELRRARRLGSQGPGEMLRSFRAARRATPAVGVDGDPLPFLAYAGRAAARSLSRARR